MNETVKSNLDYFLLWLSIGDTNGDMGKGDEDVPDNEA